MADASIKLQVDLGPNRITWDWVGNETEWRQALYAFLGTPVEVQEKGKAMKQASGVLGKMGQGVWNVTERLTRPPKK